MSFRLFLDHTAVAAFLDPARSMAVGELIVEVQEEHAAVAVLDVSVLSLLTDLAEDQRPLLRALLNNPAVFVESLLLDAYEDLASAAWWIRDLGIPCGLTAFAASDVFYESAPYILTADPSIYRQHDQLQIIEIGG